MSLVTSTFRSCTASLTSRSLACPAVVRCPTRMSRLRVRCYSEKSTAESEETKTEQKPDKVSETEEKLKAKENEVVDLTVCANLSMSTLPVI
jgi:molecular chaperone GrpE